MRGYWMGGWVQGTIFICIGTVFIPNDDSLDKKYKSVQD
jgi:hypothetical protein